MQVKCFCAVAFAVWPYVISIIATCHATDTNTFSRSLSLSFTAAFLYFYLLPHTIHIALDVLHCRCVYEYVLCADLSALLLPFSDFTFLISPNVCLSTHVIFSIFTLRPPRPVHDFFFFAPLSQLPSRLHGSRDGRTALSSQDTSV